MWPRGIFRREQTAWIVFGLYTLLLYSTLSLAFDLYVSVYQHLGRSTVSSSMNFAFVLVALAILLWVIPAYRPTAGGYAILILIALVVALCLWALAVPAKRFHFFEYAPLALFAFDALRFRLDGWRLSFATIALIGLVGLGDELIQAILPRRHFGYVDLGINLTAGILTVLFLVVVVRRQNYPWGAKGRG